MILAAFYSEIWPESNEISMKVTPSLIIATTLFMASASYGQLNRSLKNKVKSKVNSTLNKSEESTDTSSNSEKSEGLFSSPQKDHGGMRTITEEELNENPYLDEDRLFVTPDGQIIVKKLYRQEASDKIDFSGVYYLNTLGLVLPSSHFSSDTAKAFTGFTIDYSPEDYTMNIYWEKDRVNNAVILEQYQKSADKGNVMFQMGMLGGPESFYNAECVLLEPGVFLIGANVYHKNDEVGHQWMNDAQPQSFIIAAKDTSKFRDYNSNPEYTSKVVFERFDALRRVWLQGEIEDAKPLPTEGMKDAKLKAEALSFIKKTAEAYGWKETVEYAYITANDWEVRMSALTGKPLTRSLKCIVVMKTPDGNFKREGFYIGQKYTGSSYGSTYMLYNDQRIYYVNPKEAYKYK